MNYALKATNLLRPRSHGRSLQFLTIHDTNRLATFYLGLDFDNRRARFGGGQSDESIVTYCRSIDWQHAVIIARGSSHLLDAVLEIHPFSQSWDRAEITLTSPLDCDRNHIFAELLQLAALTAGGRGCKSLVMYLNDGCFNPVGILGDIGRTSDDGEMLSLDISEYAVAGTSISRPQIL
jgi:hypothetical protein